MTLSPPEITRAIADTIQVLRRALDRAIPAMATRGGFVVEVTERSTGYAWVLFEAHDRARCVAEGHSEHLEAACASAALRLVDASERA